jgi:hypothetical protein
MVHGMSDRISTSAPRDAIHLQPRMDPHEAGFSGAIPIDVHLSSSACFHDPIILAEMRQDLAGVNFQVLSQRFMVAERRQDEATYPGVDEALKALDACLRGA